MENQQPKESHKVKKIVAYILIAMFVCVAFMSLYIRNQANIRTKTTPPEYQKVSAITGIDIPISISTDGVSLYFTHNSERLSNTNRITGLTVATDYTITFTNNSGAKAGLFIPILKESIIADDKQTVTLPIRFETTGTHYLLGNIYQPGWDGLKSGFDVGTGASETPPPMAADPGTIQPQR